MRGIRTLGSESEADVIVVGSGPAGLAAAIAARDAGSSVIVLEENYDVGGHAILSAGMINLGGGHRYQRALGIEDSPDQIFEDWVSEDWLQSRHSDRTLVRRFADENVATFEFLLENGVELFPGTFEYLVTDRKLLGPMSSPRLFRSKEWPDPTGVIVRGQFGSGLVRTLERSARAKGTSFRLNHKMIRLARLNPGGPVDLVHVRTAEEELVFRARKGIVLATGGSSGNVHLRRVFDPRLTEEYQLAGAPYSNQTGDGEIAALAHGGTLWATAPQTAGTMLPICKTGHIGCQWGYHALKYPIDSPIFHRVRASGLTVSDWQNVILVNQRGERFWDEVDNSQGFINAALAYNGRSTNPNGGGPIWAIFDSAAVEREGWTPEPPHVDPAYFGSGRDFVELCANITNPYQKTLMDPARLIAQVARYNSFVDNGQDMDFGKPRPLYKIEKPPFYAAWATPILHDTFTGLRTDEHGYVLDLYGERVPGLLAAGESQGGFAQHGIARCLVFGRLAGLSAADTPVAESFLESY